jgi:nucleoside phosphorylase
MNVLIVDDQYDGKAKHISRILNSSFQGSTLDIVIGAKEALKKMKETAYELLVVDLQIPPEAGLDVESNGGRDLIQYVEMSQTLFKPRKILAVTVHQDSYDECKAFFASRGWALLLNPGETELKELLTAQLSAMPDSFPKVDIAFLTALEKTELEAVLALPLDWKAATFRDDFTSYHVGELTLKDGTKKSVVAASAPRMGLAAAAGIATKICLQFRPAVLVMTGIAAAVKGEANIGDILVADPSWDWGSGKLTIRKGKVTLLSEPVQIPLEPAIASRLRSLAVSRTYLDEIYAAWRGGKRPPHDIQVHVGPVASGAVVLEDPATVDLIKSQNRKTVGIEMEAFGVMSAVFYAGHSRPAVLVMKSVCDFADPTKNNEWQSYAAYTSAEFAFRYLRDHAFGVGGRG